MTLASWAFIAEIGGVIAVVVTLVFLTIQLRQNTLALRSSATNEVHEQLAEIYFLTSQSPDSASIFVRGCYDPSKLEPVELARYYAALTGVTFVLQNVLMQTKNNLLDPEILESWSRSFGALTSTQGFKSFWEERRAILSRGVQTYVDELMKDNKTRHYRPLGAPPID